MVAAPTPAIDNVSENTTTVTNVNATDDADTEGSGLTYSLTPTNSSFDNGLFTLNANTGFLAFISAPDFETPLDANADNVYVLQVTVTDSGGLTDLQNIQVTVLNEDDAAPTAVDDGGAAFTINEDSGLFTTPDVTTNDTDPEDGTPTGDVVITVPLAPVGAGTLEASLTVPGASNSRRLKTSTATPRSRTQWTIPPGRFPIRRR